MAVDHDGLFKELLKTFFVDFVELFAPEVLQYGDMESITFADAEMVHDGQEIGTNRADLVVQTRWTNKREAYFYIHVEVQSQRQDHFADRMLNYFVRLRELHRAPIYPIALFTFDERRRDEPHTITVCFPEYTVLYFEFRKVYLRRLDWRKYLDRPNAVAAALMAKMGFEPHERARVKAECLRLLVTLKLDPDKTRLIGKFVDTYLQLDEQEIVEYNEIMEAMPVADKQAVAEIVTSWERIGLEKGREEGRAEGRQEGRQEGREEGLEEGRKQGVQNMRRLLVAMVESKFDTMPAEHKEALTEFSLARLEEFALAVTTAASYDGLSARFFEP